jgi:hypothetical protein
MVVKPVAKAKKTKKQRKFGRNAKYCLYYKVTHVREKNKMKRLKKHLIKFPNDKCALEAINRCKMIVTGRID